MPEGNLQEAMKGMTAAMKLNNGLFKEGNLGNLIDARDSHPEDVDKIMVFEAVAQ